MRESGVLLHEVQVRHRGLPARRFFAKLRRPHRRAQSSRTVKTGKESFAGAFLRLTVREQAGAKARPEVADPTRPGGPAEQFLAGKEHPFLAVSLCAEGHCILNNEAAALLGKEVLQEVDRCDVRGRDDHLAHLNIIIRLRSSLGCTMDSITRIGPSGCRCPVRLLGSGIPKHLPPRFFTCSCCRRW